MIEKVKGDFRQEEIVEKWTEVLQTSHTFAIATIEVACSSGTYMRTLAENLGKKLGVPALALKIVRTKIGNNA